MRDFDKDVLESEIETIEEILKNGRFPNGKKISGKDRESLTVEKEVLKKILQQEIPGQYKIF